MSSSPALPRDHPSKSDGESGVQNIMGKELAVSGGHGIPGSRIPTQHYPNPVLQRRPLMIEPGGLEGGGVESGLLKMGIEGGGSLMS